MGFNERENKRQSNPVLNLIGIKEEIPGQETIETLEDGKYLPENKKVDTSIEEEPKVIKEEKVSKSLKKENKSKEPMERYTQLVDMEIMEDLKKISIMKQYKDLSSYVREILEKDRNKNKNLVSKYDEFIN